MANEGDKIILGVDPGSETFSVTALHINRTGDIVDVTTFTEVPPPEPEGKE